MALARKGPLMDLSPLDLATQIAAIKTATPAAVKAAYKEMFGSGRPRVMYRCECGHIDSAREMRKHTCEKAPE